MLHGALRHRSRSGTPRLLLEGAPYLRAWAGGLWLATNKPNPLGPGSTGLHGWRVEVFTSGDASTWTAHTTVNPTFPNSEGPAVAGPDSALVIADPAGGGTSGVVETYRNSRGVTSPQTTQISTGTPRTVSLVHGPAGRVYNLDLVFSHRFQLLLPTTGPRNPGRDDVTLNVQHLDQDGNVRAAITDWVVPNADRLATHFWHEGRATTDFPRITITVQRGETILFDVSRGGSVRAATYVSSRLSVDTLIDIALSNTSGAPLKWMQRVDNPSHDEHIAFQVEFDYSLSRTP